MLILLESITVRFISYDSDITVYSGIMFQTVHVFTLSVSVLHSKVFIKTNQYWIQMASIKNSVLILTCAKAEGNC